MPAPPRDTLGGGEGLVRSRTRGRCWVVPVLGIVALLVPTAACAIGADEFLRSPGAEAFRQGRYEDALAGFERLLERYPDDALILRYIGITQDRLGRYAEAVATYRRAVAVDPRDAALHLFLGIAHYHLRDAGSAREALARAVELGPDSPYAQRAQEYLDVMARQAAEYARPGAPRRWNLSLRAGVEFDTNVPQAPADRSVFPGDRDGVRFTQYLAGTYRLLAGGPWEARIEGSVYYSEHPDRDLNDFDVSALEAGLVAGYATAVAGLPVLPAARYAYKPVYQQGHRYSEAHTVTASVNVGFTRETTTSLAYRLAFLDFRDEGFDPRLSSRDATSHALGVTHYLYFAERRGYVWGGYEYQWSDADGLNFESRTHRVGGGVAAPVPLGARLDVSAEYARDDYPDFQGPRKRQTDRWSASVALSRPVWEPLVVTLSYSYRREDSSLDQLDYDRHIVGLTMGFSF